MTLRERARKAEDKELRRRAIIDAARAVFAERGLTGFAMAEVAARAGVVKGTLYLYWPTREELLLAVLEELLWAWMAELDARLDDLRAPAGPPRPAGEGWGALGAVRTPLGLLGGAHAGSAHIASRGAVVVLTFPLTAMSAPTHA